MLSLGYFMLVAIVIIILMVLGLSFSFDEEDNWRWFKIVLVVILFFAIVGLVATAEEKSYLKGQWDQIHGKSRYEHVVEPTDYWRLKQLY